MTEGKRRLESGLSDLLGKKADRLRLYPALLGAYVNGQKTLRVANRKDYVWCRLRGATSEVVQALNETVGLHFDLPILVYRDVLAANSWRVQGRDISQYSDWEGASYLPPHGDSHSFGGGPKTGIDPVWISKRQFMPMLPHPNPTGTMGIYIEPDFWYRDAAYHFWPGSGTADLSPFKPTGANQGRFVTVYLSGSFGVPALMPGPPFPATSPPADPGQFILLPSPLDGIPIAAAFLLTGTRRLGWGEIYDLRYPVLAPPFVAGVTGAVMVLDEGILLGAATHVDFTGPGVSATISGSFVRVDISGGGGPGGGGSGTNATYSLAGMATPLDPPTSQFWRVPVYPYATGSLSIMLNGVWQKPGLDFTEQWPQSGTFALAAVPPTGTVSAAMWGILAGGDTGSAGQIGLYFTDHGVPVGTGSRLDAGYGLRATISGTVVRLDVQPPTTGTIVLRDEAAVLGSVSILDFVGDGVTADISGAYGRVTIPGSVGGSGLGVMVTDDGVPVATGTTLEAGYGLKATASGSVVRLDLETPVTGTVVVADEGALLGSARLLNFTGGGVNASISGAYATVDIPGAAPVGNAGIMYEDDGRPLGTGTTVDLGLGLHGSLSGTNIRLDGGYFYADSVSSSSGSPVDWHFEGVNALWTVTGAVPIPPFDVDASWPSHFHTVLSGTQTIRLEADSSGYFDPTSGSVSITAAFVISIDQANGDVVQVTAQDELGGNAMRASYGRPSLEPPELRLDKVVGGVSTFAINPRDLYHQTRVYLHLERQGTGSWGAAVSFDGLGWIGQTSLHNQYFGVTGSHPVLTRIVLSQERGSGGLMLRQPRGIDWVALNKLFLYS